MSLIKYQTRQGMITIIVLPGVRNRSTLLLQECSIQVINITVATKLIVQIILIVIIGYLNETTETDPFNINQEILIRYLRRLLIL